MSNIEKSDTIDILLATYNGAGYIKEQIDSIINQTYDNWKLYIRDDQSKDDTVAIIKGYQNIYPDKIILVDDDQGGLGAKLNFFELLKCSKNRYCMFCDQDDVWLKDKIKITLDKMKQAEDKYGDDTPILVHTNLKVVDEKLNIIDDSFWSYQKLDPKMTKLNNLLLQNNITGCTVMINKALAKESLNIPIECVMHDWWLGLVASALGHIEIIEQPTMLYRQHSSNEVGAKNYKSIKFIQSKLKIVDKSIESGLRQGKEFAKLYQDKLNNEDKIIVDEFSRLREQNLVKRKISIINNKFYQSGLVRNIGYILFI